jgi:hypothetical protein
MRAIPTNSIEFKYEMKNKKTNSFQKEENYISDKEEFETIKDKCIICEQAFEEEEFKDSSKINQLVNCKLCETYYHICCLAEVSLQDDSELIPKVTTCVVCGSEYHWNELIN